MENYMLMKNKSKDVVRFLELEIQPDEVVEIQDIYCNPLPDRGVSIISCMAPQLVKYIGEVDFSVDNSVEAQETKPKVKRIKKVKKENI